MTLTSKFDQDQLPVSTYSSVQAVLLAYPHVQVVSLLAPVIQHCQWSQSATRVFIVVALPVAEVVD